MNPYAIEIFSDGSSKVHAGFKSGSGVAIVFPEHAKKDTILLNHSYDRSKIGAMEISGINKGMEWLIDNSAVLSGLNINSAIIYCDNDVIVECANSHVFNWSNNSWEKRGGGSISNLDSWKKYMTLRRKMKGIILEIKRIKRRSNDGARLADDLAKKSAESIPRLKNYDFMPQKSSDNLTVYKFPLETYSGHKESLIRIYFHQIVNKRKNSDVKIYFEEIKNDEVVGRFLAFSSIEFNQKYIDRKNYYKVKFDLENKNRPLFKQVEKIQGDELKKMKKKMKQVYGKC